MNTDQTIPGWDVLELKRRLDAGESLAVLDVREPFERDYGALALPGSAIDLHIPLDQIPEHLEDLRQAVNGRPLVVYCHHGVRSLAVAQWLHRQGFSDVNNLEGGIDAWSLAIDPAVARY
ncbi:rhodanese-like domain-containing protein [soil metagenome]